MKVSVSLPDEDVEFLDVYADTPGIASAAAVHMAVRLLRASQLGAACELESRQRLSAASRIPYRPRLDGEATERVLIPLVANRCRDPSCTLVAMR